VRANVIARRLRTKFQPFLVWGGNDRKDRNPWNARVPQHGSNAYELMAPPGQFGITWGERRARIVWIPQSLNLATPSVFDKTYQSKPGRRTAQRHGRVASFIADAH
jgi:hypothetical protein